jgi:large subunit ribosomal protein L30
MAGIKVTLVRSMSGHVEAHRETLRGLGLTRRGMTRVVQDTPATRGMVDKVRYLLEVEQTKESFKPYGRRYLKKQAAAKRAAKAKA